MALLNHEIGNSFAFWFADSSAWINMPDLTTAVNVQIVSLALFFAAGGYGIAVKRTSCMGIHADWFCMADSTIAEQSVSRHITKGVRRRPNCTIMVFMFYSNIFFYLCSVHYCTIYRITLWKINITIKGYWYWILNRNIDTHLVNRPFATPGEHESMGTVLVFLFSSFRH